MKSLSFKLLGFVFCTAVISTSCKKDPPQDVQSPAQKLRGKVELKGVYGGTQLENRAGTQAIVSGEFQNFTANTDNSGRFEYDNLPNGTYSVTVSREGYTPMPIYNIIFSRNSPTLPVNGEYQLLPTITLGQKSLAVFDTTTVTTIYNTEIVSQDTIDGEIIIVIDTLSADVFLRSVRMSPHSPNPAAKFGYRLYLGKAANTSPANYIQTFHGVMHGAETDLELLWTQEQWQSWGFVKGDLVYVKVYGDSVDELDYQSIDDQRVFPNLSEEFDGDSDIIVPF